MAARQGLNELAEAKRLVVLQGELHRNLLRLECATLRDRFAGLAGMSGNPGAGRSLLVAGAALAGALTFRRGRALLRWAPALVATYRWVRRLLRDPG